MFVSKSFISKILRLAFPGVMLFAVPAGAQVDSSFRFYFYDQRYSLFSLLPETPGDIIMLGNSITNGCNWSEIFNNPRVKNRGISGDNTFGVLHRLHQITDPRPEKVFILIGINDIANNTPVEIILNNYRKIVERIQKESPDTRIYLQSLFPTNNEFDDFPAAQNKDDQIRMLNQGIAAIAEKNFLAFIDLYTPFLCSEGKLDKAYTNDGLHLLGAGYMKWAEIIRPHIEENIAPSRAVPEGDLYYQRKKAMHEAMPMPAGAYVLLGNSITEHGMWSELLPGTQVVNRGIGGDNLQGMYQRLPAIVAHRPSAIFLMAGINNILFYDARPWDIVLGIEKMIQFIQQQSPDTRIYVQSILPVNDIAGGEQEFLRNRHSVITRTNEQLKLLAQSPGVEYIDLHTSFKDDWGRLKEELTTDGVHLNARGYFLWAEHLQELVK